MARSSVNENRFRFVASVSWPVGTDAEVAVESTVSVIDLVASCYVVSMDCRSSIPDCDHGESAPVCVAFLLLVTAHSW